MLKKPIGCIVAGALAATSWALDAVAQEFPSRPIHVVVPTAAGGPADIVSRIVGERMAQSLGQPLIVEARPGASGLIGTRFVASAQPDGHTLLVFSNTFIMLPSLVDKIPIDIFKDIAPVGLVVSSPNVLVVHPDLKVKTLKEFIAAAKQQPQGFAYGSPAAGSAAHLTVELLKQRVNIPLNHVPFRGPQPALQEALAGRVPVTIAGVSNALPYIRAGTLTPLAIADVNRSPLLPDVPTFDELGIGGMNLPLWFGMFTTGGTPAETIARLNKELNAALKSPDVIEKLAKVGFGPVGGTPQEFMQVMKREQPIYGKLLTDLGLGAK